MGLTLILVKKNWYCRWCGEKYKPDGGHHYERDGFCCEAHQRSLEYAFNRSRKMGRQVQMKDEWYCRFCGQQYTPDRVTQRDGFCRHEHKLALWRALHNYEAAAPVKGAWARKRHEMAQEEPGDLPDGDQPRDRSLGGGTSSRAPLGIASELLEAGLAKIDARATA
jgi:hypothetical protein